MPYRAEQLTPKLKLAIGSLLSVLLVPSANAQDLEPRSFANIPTGMHFLVLGAVHSEGDFSPSPSIPVQNATLISNAGVFGYAQTFAIAGSSSKLDVVGARLCIHGRAEVNDTMVEGGRCGYTDPQVRLTWNFYGAPALKRTEFAQYDPRVVIGTSLQVSVPVGTYDETKLLNAGANQWIFRPSIGMSQHLGDWYYNLIAAVRLYGDNDAYFNQVYVEQAPQYSMQAHLIYTVAQGQWVSLSGNYFYGGETKKNGVWSKDEQSNSRFGLTYSFSLSQSQSIKLYASRGVITRIGNDFDTFGVVWQYAF